MVAKNLQIRIDEIYMCVCVGAKFLITLQVWNILDVVTDLF